MIYRIEQYWNDDIKVFKEISDVPSLSLKRKTNWWGDIISKFYLEDVLVLQTKFKKKIFHFEVSLSYQNLQKSVNLTSGKDDYQLICGNDAVTMRKSSLNRLHYQFYLNETIVGGMSWRENRNAGMMIYFLKFYEDSEMNLYYIILFLMQLDGVPT